MIRLMIADDQELIRDSLKLVLNTNPDMEVVGTAGNGIELLKLLREEAADVILMDIRMPGMDGIVATKEVKDKYPLTKVIILTTFDDEEYVMDGLRYGASGYLLKGITIPELTEAIRKVALGEAMLNKDIVTKVVKLFNKAMPTMPTLDDNAPQKSEFYIDVYDEGPGELNRNERNICRLAGRGLSNKEMARELSFSEGTIRNSLSSALNKLGLRDRTQLAIWAVQTGMAAERLEL